MKIKIKKTRGKSLGTYMKIKVILSQYAILKSLSLLLAGKNSFFGYVAYNAKNKEAVALTQQIIRVEKIDLGSKDLFFKKEEFKAAISTEELSKTLQASVIPKPFPSYELWLNKRKYIENKKPLPVLYLSLSFLCTFEKTLLNKDTKLKFLVTENKEDPIKIFDGERNKLLGVIAPLV